VEEELIQRVMEGSADCGFIWEEELLGEDLWERDAVTQVTGTFTNKGLLAKETTFSILLRLKGEVLPLSTEEQIFGGKDADREETIQNRYEELLGMDSLFTIDFRNANYEQEPEEEKGYLGKTDIVRGMVALLLFMYCLFGFGVDTLSAEKRPWNYLSRGAKEQMLWSNLLARMTVPGIFGFVLIRYMAQPADFGVDLLKYLGFLLYSLVWCRVIGSIFRRRESYAATFLIILLLHLFLCPIFFDAQMLSPVLGRLGYLLPTGWYLR
jgi:hypothetical protein